MAKANRFVQANGILKARTAAEENTGNPLLIQHLKRGGAMAGSERISTAGRVEIVLEEATHVPKCAAGIGSISEI